MNPMPDTLIRPRLYAWLAVTLLCQSPAGIAQQAPIIQPGAPGAPARELSAGEAIEIADTSYSPDDVRFLQDMIPHHHQAIEMAALVAGRTNRPEIIDAAGRINTVTDRHRLGLFPIATWVRLIQEAGFAKPGIVHDRWHRDVFLARPDTAPSTT